MQNSPRWIPEVMPTKERYERDKAYYHAWNTSERGKAAVRDWVRKSYREGQTNC